MREQEIIRHYSGLCGSRDCFQSISPRSNIYDGTNNNCYHHYFHFDHSDLGEIKKSASCGSNHLGHLKAKVIEQPAIYKELDYVHMAPKPASSPTIDTG